MIRVRIEPVVHPDFVLDAEQMAKAKSMIEDVRRVWREREREYALLRNLWPVDLAGSSTCTVGRPEKHPFGVVGYLSKVES